MIKNRYEMDNNIPGFTESFFTQGLLEGLKEDLRKLSDEYSISLSVVDLEGKQLTGIRCSRVCSICDILHEDNQLISVCKNERKKAVKESFRWGEPYIYRCFFNLLLVSVPLINLNQLVGGLIAYPFVMWAINKSDLPTAELKKLKLKKSTLFTMLKKTPVFNQAKVKAVSDRLYEIGEKYSRPDYLIMQEHKKISSQESNIAVSIHKAKRQAGVQDKKNVYEKFFLYENELIRRVKTGDRSGAREILNEFLGAILLQNPLNLNILKAHILELVVILSRSAVEEGCDLNDILGLRYKYVTELASIENQSELCLWVIEILDNIVSNIYATRNIKHPELLQRVMNFLEENYHKQITLEDVSKIALLSPFRFSHVFREEMGLTFINYLTKTRINKAKVLLKETNLSLSEVACKVGFSDQSYFTKVFKKIESITPREFRTNKYSKQEQQNIPKE